MWFFFGYIEPMDFFDKSYLTVQKQYKPKYKQRANSFALWFVSALQIGLLLLFGYFLFLFIKETRTIYLSADKAWLFFILTCLFIIIRNWLRYGGRQLKIRRAKSSATVSSGQLKFSHLLALLISVYLVSFLFISICKLN